MMQDAQEQHNMQLNTKLQRHCRDTAKIHSEVSSNRERHKTRCDENAVPLQGHNKNSECKTHIARKHNMRLDKRCKHTAGHSRRTTDVPQTYQKVSKNSAQGSGPAIPWNFAVCVCCVPAVSLYFAVRACNFTSAS